MSRSARKQRSQSERVATAHVETIDRLCRHIAAHREEPLPLAALAELAGLSPPHLQRIFKRVTGITPRQYADACRLGRLKETLKQQGTVTMALYEAGYGSSRGLYERASAQLGMTPATYQRGGRGMRIGYTLVDCPLGRLLLGATERGVCAVCLGNSDRALVRSLKDEYPEAELQRDGVDLAPWVREFLAYLTGKQPHLDLPLDVRATAFQWRVWQHLQSIPCGETRSYRAVAQALGEPTAARAVARACATNPVAVLIPCHRVVREDGGLGGYRWGLERKQALLERERELAAKKTPRTATVRER